MSELQYLEYAVMYQLLYKHNLRILPQIKKQYPAFKNDIKNDASLKSLRQYYFNLNNDEFLAHCLAMSTILYITGAKMAEQMYIYEHDISKIK